MMAAELKAARRLCVTTILFLLCISSSIASADGWHVWQRELKLWCPSHHVDWICDECYIDLIEDFDRTLPKRTRLKVTKVADYSRRCATEQAGFSCEMAVHLDAMNRLGLMTRFARFGCSHYSCSEQSICTSN